MSEAKFKVISDSCCDLPKEIVTESDIDIVPLYVAFSDGEYHRDFYDFTYHDFYKKMLDRPGDFPKTFIRRCWTGRGTSQRPPCREWRTT